MANKQPAATTVVTQEPIVIRPASLFDISEMGRIAAEAYFDSGLSQFLSPHRHKYYSDWKRGFTQRAFARLLSPRNRSFIATTASDPSTLVGYVHSVRLGDDYGAWQVVREKGLLWRLFLWGFGWVFWVYCKILGMLVVDRSEDTEAVRKFNEWCEQDDKLHWEEEERINRWHVQSMVVDPKYHRRGIGRKLMTEVLKRAEEQNVCVGLEASAQGQNLYRSVGYELLGKFTGDEVETGGGGIMIWTPPAWKQKESIKV